MDCDWDAIIEYKLFVKNILYGNIDLWVSKVVIFYYLVSNMVVWKVIGDVGTPCE